MQFEWGNRTREGENCLWQFEDALLGRSGRALARERSKTISDSPQPVATKTPESDRVFLLLSETFAIKRRPPASSGRLNVECFVRCLFLAPV